MDGRPSCTDCDEAGDYVVPNVLSPRDLVFRPDNMDETVPHTYNFVMMYWSYGIKMTKVDVTCAVTEPHHGCDVDMSYHHYVPFSYVAH